MAENKLFYSISDIAEMFAIPQSNIRHWEKEIDMLKPNRSVTGIRRYTPEDVETFRSVYYLIKVKGLKLDAVNRHLKSHQPEDIARETKVVEKLHGIKSFIEATIASINSADEGPEIFIDQGESEL